MKASEGGKGLLSAIGLRTFSSLQHANYRLYFFGMLGQFASMNMQMVAGSNLIYHLTGSSALLGTMSLANALPMIVLSMFGGAIADRVQKKWILFVGLIGAAVISGGVGIALATGYLSQEHAGSWWVLMASSFSQGAVMGMMMPARQAIIPEIVSRQQTMNAVALNMLGMNILRMLAPGVAGYMIEYVDFEAVYFTMTAMNVYAAVVISFIPHTSRIVSRGGNIVADIQRGFKYILQEKTILYILLFTLIIVVLSMPYQQLLPIFVSDDILGVGASGQGLLMMVSGAGALVGSLIVASISNRMRGLILLFSGLISGFALVSFAFSAVWSLSLVFMVFVGLGMTLRATLSNALLQSYVEGPYMGRVLSILNMEWGVVSLCTFAAGLMAEVMPVQWVVGTFAIALIMLTLLAMVFVPSLRRLD